MPGGFLGKIIYKLRRKLNLETLQVNGIKVCVDERLVPKSIRKQLLQKRYESQELELVRATLVAGDKVLEIGAGIGFIGIACTRICGPGNVLSYEANPAMMPLIEKNYALNGLEPNLVARVVAAQSGEAEFFFSDHPLSSSLVDREKGKPSVVKADAIADVVEDFEPTAIVMDAEGAEIDLLRNCSLEKIRKMIVEMHPHVVGNEAIESLCDHLSTAGFAVTKRMAKVYVLERVQSDARDVL